MRTNLIPFFHFFPPFSRSKKEQARKLKQKLHYVSIFHQENESKQNLSLTFTIFFFILLWTENTINQNCCHTRGVLCNTTRIHLGIQLKQYLNYLVFLDKPKE